jgi:hypothetical protein
MKRKLMMFAVGAGVAVLGAGSAFAGGPAEWFAPNSAVKGVGSGLCLDVTGGKTAPGSALEIWPCTGNPNQRWTLNSSGELVGMGSNLCLDVFNGDTAPGSKLDIWPCTGNPNQQWRVTSSGGLVSAQSGLCLDVFNGDTAPGSALEIWPCTGNPNQQWGSVPSAPAIVVSAIQNAFGPVLTIDGAGFTPNGNSTIEFDGIPTLNGPISFFNPASIDVTSGFSTVYSGFDSSSVPGGSTSFCSPSQAAGVVTVKVSDANTGRVAVGTIAASYWCLNY